jgi:D-amino peptidase
MRVYISVDMEGVAGVVHEDQTNPIDPRHAGEYNRFRRLMTSEANAAVEGAVLGGAKTIVVNDSHWQMRNLLPDELHPAAELLSGGPKLRSMVEGVEAGFDAALFVGYHARGGTKHAIIDHTYTSNVHEVRLNGQPAGELAINAALAGTYGVPVAMVSGDQALAAEAKELLGATVEAVIVKHAVGRFAARSVHPGESCRRIREGATAALRRSHRPYVLSAPITLDVEFALTQMADMAELTPGSVRTGGRTLQYRHDDYREVFRAWRAFYNLASVD